MNGGLFSGSLDVPRFSKIARSYLLHIGGLDWKQINPDIFGSMIQAVAEDEERGALGMHYTSVPNILKVLNPLFLDDLRAQLEEAGDNPRMLLNLRKRMARIRVFDPACGSGNFLVIAYKEMRAIEAEINRRRGEADRRSEIPLTNFRGIELRDFPAEIARLALIIAEYQCDVLYRGQKEALAEFLPLDAENWITCGNALRLDWLSICPPTGTGVKHQADDLFQHAARSGADRLRERGRRDLYLRKSAISGQQVADRRAEGRPGGDLWRRVRKLEVARLCGRLVHEGCRLRDCRRKRRALSCPPTQSAKGEQVPMLWPLDSCDWTSRSPSPTRRFKWANLASHNAGVTVVIVGIVANACQAKRLIYDGGYGASKYELTSTPILLLAKSMYIVKSDGPSPLGCRQDGIWEHSPRTAAT